MLQVGHDIIMAYRMAQSGALRTDVTTTVAYYGDEQVNREETTGAGHNVVASGTQYHNGRQDGSRRCTTTRCNNHGIRLIMGLNRYKHRLSTSYISYISTR
jgi:hypothetical protein